MDKSDKKTVFKQDFLKNLGIDTEHINLILSEAQKLQTEFNKAKADYNKLLSDIQREKIHSALHCAGAKNITAAEALIDKNKLKFNGISIDGLEEEINRIKNENNFLFSSGSMPYVVTAANRTDSSNYAMRHIMGL